VQSDEMEGEVEALVEFLKEQDAELQDAERWAAEQRAAEQAIRERVEVQIRAAEGAEEDALAAAWAEKVAARQAAKQAAADVAKQASAETPEAEGGGAEEGTPPVAEVTSPAVAELKKHADATRARLQAQAEVDSFLQVELQSTVPAAASVGQRPASPAACDGDVPRVRPSPVHLATHSPSRSHHGHGRTQLVLPAEVAAAGWRVAVSGQTGQHFYHHAATGRSQYHLPQPPPEEPPAVAGQKGTSPRLAHALVELEVLDRRMDVRRQALQADMKAQRAWQRDRAAPAGRRKRAQSTGRARSRLRERGPPRVASLTRKEPRAEHSGPRSPRPARQRSNSTNRVTPDEAVARCA
jgi:hypothetical protein